METYVVGTQKKKAPQRDGSFEHLKQMFKLMNIKENIHSFTLKLVYLHLYLMAL